jgi:TonB family protein
MQLESKTSMTPTRRRRFQFLCVTLAVALWFAQAGLCEELKRTTARELRSYPGAQNSPSTTESAIAALVKSLAEPLKTVKARNVVVLDLRGPDGHLHPAGKWFADQVSAAIRNEFPKIKTIDRSQLSSNDETAGTPMDAEAVFRREIHQARLVGADVAISGNFAAVSDQIGVSLDVIKLADLGKTHNVRAALIPISKELTDLASEAIPTLELVDGIPRAGKSGIGMPVCTYRPNKSSGRSGSVILEIVVTKDGRPERIKVIKSPDPELAAFAVQAVQSWRCKPALGFDGNPIAVVTPIQITFR